MPYRKAWLQPQGGGQGFFGTQKVYGGRIPILAADVALTGNVVGLFMLPANFCVVDMVGPLMPAFGTALVAALGDAGLNNRYAATIPNMAAGGALPAMAATGTFFRTTQDTEIQLAVTTQSSAPAAGTLELYFRGFIYA